MESISISFKSSQGQIPVQPIFAHMRIIFLSTFRRSLPFSISCKTLLLARKIPPQKSYSLLANDCKYLNFSCAFKASLWLLAQFFSIVARTQLLLSPNFTSGAQKCLTFKQSHENDGNKWKDACTSVRDCNHFQLIVQENDNNTWIHTKL